MSAPARPPWWPGQAEQILGSLHAIPYQDGSTAADELFRVNAADEVMRRYFAELLRLVEGSGICPVLAHLDFPRRIGPGRPAPTTAAFEAEYRPC